jgi:hypothetical protein
MVCSVTPKAWKEIHTKLHAELVCKRILRNILIMGKQRWQEPPQYGKHELAAFALVLPQVDRSSGRSS